MMYVHTIIYFASIASPMYSSYIKQVWWAANCLTSIPAKYNQVLSTFHKAIVKIKMVPF